MSEDGLHETFASLCREEDALERDQSGSWRFSSRTYAALLQKHSRSYSLSPFLLIFGPLVLDATLSEKVAAIHLEKLLDRKVISKIDAHDVEQWYAVDPEAVERFR